jgi:L-alanine-DL-glutamate epimerase-like enolase superfamily enzyme
VTVKLTRVGGITPAVTIRDVAVELGIGVTVEDGSGCNLADTTFAHMNASTPARLRVHTVDFDSWVTVTHVDGPSARDGSVVRPQADAPGLGLRLREDILGDPFLDLGDDAIGAAATP